MKRLAVYAVLFSLALFILLPSCSPGKFTVSNSSWADGNPLPWPKPPSNAVLTADGNPLPWPKPPSDAVLSADGNPLPWPKPPSDAVLSADGNPLPWPKPPSTYAVSV